MKYQKIKNLLDNTPNQPTKFRARNWVEINGDARGTYTNTRCDDNTCEMMILVSGTIVVTALAGAGVKNGIQLVFKSCTSLTNCISEINHI